MLMRQPQPDLALTYAPVFGARTRENGVEFRVYSHSATGMRVLLYDTPDDREPAEVIELDASRHRFGDVWKLAVPGIGHGQLYHFQADGPQIPDWGYRFDPQARLIDPYAQALAGDFQLADDRRVRPPKCVVIDEPFDWQGDRPLNYHLPDLIIYEMHVGGFTRSPTSHAEFPGTYLGVIEKIPYLRTLGVTTVELMPVHEFPILAPDGRPRRLGNYWGYDPMAFFSPHRGYAVGSEPGAQVGEFKQMVRALHQAGIEVVLDVVFNHTCEGNEHGPTLSFKGLENNVYYMTEQGGRYYKNYSGCGNTLNCNHPIVTQMILESLRHWVVNYHIDGFRFDLAAVFRRGCDGGILGTAPLVEAIAEDPYLSQTKLIAEAWDAGGAYLVGSFGGPRWAEWNGIYRDDVRKFWRGDPGMRGAMATRLAGSSDLYERGGRGPSCSVNFVTSHDGFTINDLVSFNHKHNEANGEGNRDGDNNNLSYNYGHEGPTKNSEIQKLRLRQIKNLLATMLLSQGVPMLVMGDECRRTQRGNNNAYCQDNPISWLNWDFIKNNRELVRFCRTLIKFRRGQPTLRRQTYLRGEPNGHDPRPEVGWFNARGEAADWSHPAKSLSCLLTRPPADQDPQSLGRDILLMLNAEAGPQEFQFPATTALSDNWRQFINTAGHAPQDIFPNLGGPAPPKSGRLILPGRTLVCYVAGRADADPGASRSN
jgi:glycogen operon protein